MDTVNGQIRVRGWPRPRGASASPAQAANRAKFADAQRTSRFIAPQTYTAIVEATRDTPLLPRDIITMMLYNRVYIFDLPDGRQLVPKPAKNDVEQALDVLTQEPGMTIVKTETGWDAAPYGQGAQNGAAVAEYRTLQNRGSYDLEWQTIPGSAVMHDRGGWIDPATWTFNPLLPGWYLTSALVWCSNNALGGIATINGRGDLWSMTPPIYAPTTIVSGQALVLHDPAWGPFRVCTYNQAATVIVGHDFRNMVQVMGPLAPA